MVPQNISTSLSGCLDLQWGLERRLLLLVVPLGCIRNAPEDGNHWGCQGYLSFPRIMQALRNIGSGNAIGSYFDRVLVRNIPPWIWHSCSCTQSIQDSSARLTRMSLLTACKPLSIPRNGPWLPCVSATDSFRPFVPVRQISDVTLTPWGNTETSGSGVVICQKVSISQWDISYIHMTNQIGITCVHTTTKLSAYIYLYIYI